MRPYEIHTVGKNGNLDHLGMYSPGMLRLASIGVVSLHKPTGKRNNCNTRNTQRSHCRGRGLNPWPLVGKHRTCESPLLPR